MKNKEQVAVITGNGARALMQAVLNWLKTHVDEIEFLYAKTDKVGNVWQCEIHYMAVEEIDPPIKKEPPCHAN